MKIAVLSGKGGTGKTTVASCLALASRVGNILKDTDVESPNLKGFISPRVLAKDEFSLRLPVVDRDKCTLCKACLACRFNAIAIIKKKVLIYNDLCRHCGYCSIICPVNAITEQPYIIGHVLKSEGKNSVVYSGELNAGENHPDKLIWAIKEKSSSVNLEIIDSPPGTGNEIFISVKDINFAIIVTEPNLFALNDLKILYSNLKNENFKFGVIINKSGESDNIITDFCLKEGLEILGKIPFDLEIARLSSRGIPFIEEFSEYYKFFRDILTKIETRITNG